METKMKFKVGEKVIVKTFEWWDAQPKDQAGDIYDGSKPAFTEGMTRFCGEKLTIIEKTEDSYRVAENPFNWHDYMFENDNDKKITSWKQEK